MYKEKSVKFKRMKGNFFIESIVFLLLGFFVFSAFNVFCYQNFNKNTKAARAPGSIICEIIFDMDFASFDNSLDAESGVECNGGNDITTFYLGCDSAVSSYVSSTADCYYLSWFDETGTGNYEYTETLTPEFAINALKAKYPKLKGFYNLVGTYVEIDPNTAISTYEKVTISSSYYDYYWVWRAIWANDTYDITLDTNGGIATSEVISVESSVAQTTKVSIPTKEGYKFNGYYTATTGGTQYVDENGNVLTSLDFSTPIETLYAQWTEILYYELTLNVTINENASLMVLIYDGNDFYQSVVFLNSNSVKINLPKNNTYKIAFSKTFVGQIKVNEVVNYGLLDIVVSNTAINIPTLNIVATSNSSAINKIII